MTNMKLAMLYSHWVAADAIYATRHAITPGDDDDEFAQQVGSKVAETARFVSGFYRMLIFYALLYVVVEAYGKFNERSDELDRLINEGPVNNLRRLRNAVFHVQDEPFTPKLWDFLLTPESEKWVHRVRRGFEDFFRDRLPIDAALTALREQHENSSPHGENSG